MSGPIPKLVPVTFERGLDESQEASQLQDGSASALENWVPESSGGLRCRQGWLNFGTTSAPSTRKARGLGFYSRNIADATPQLVQAPAPASSSASTTVAKAWDSATIANSLLLAWVTYEAPTAKTVTPPASWSLVTQKQTSTAAGNKIEGFLYAINNAGSRSGTETFTFSASTTNATIHLFEYSGMATSSNDVSATNSGLNAEPITLTTGTTATTAQAAELWFGALLTSTGDGSYATPTNGFSILNTKQSGGTSAHIESACLSKIVSATGAATTGATYGGGAGTYGWVGLVATFKAGVTSAAKQILVAHNSGTQYVIYRADRLTPSGSWTSTDTIAASSPTKPVAFAAGLSNILYVNTDFSTVRRWDNSAAASIAGSPPGRTIAFHKNRFFVAGTAANPSRLWYSDLADYATWGANSYIDIGLDDGEPITDLCPFEDALLIVKENSLHILTGTSPQDFAVHKLNAGGGYAAGRVAVSTPYGAIIAGNRAVWLYTGGPVEEIGNPVEVSYAPAGDFVTTAYIDDTCYICDEGSGTMYAYNVARQSWWMEKVDPNTTEAPACTGAIDSTLYYGPQAATTTSLAAYRQIPGAARGKDHGTLTETFRAVTPELWLASVANRITGVRAKVRWRQRGGTTGQTSCTCTPYYDGVAGVAVALTTQANPGVYRTIVPMGTAMGNNYIQLRFDHAIGAAEAALIDIEQVLIELDVEPNG